jgi:general secretion pathway protein C
MGKRGVQGGRKSGKLLELCCIPPSLPGILERLSPQTMKKLTLLNIGLALLVSMAAGLLVSDLLAHRMSRIFSTPGGRAGAPSPPAAEDLSAYAPVLEKGLFGKATQGKLTPVVAAPPPRNAAAQQSAVDILLLGTAVGSFRETFALVQKGTTKEEKVVRLGEKVFDLGPLLAVRKESIEVSVNGKRTVIRAPSAPGEAGAAPPTSPQPQVTLATHVGGGNYVIDQNRLNSALDNIGQAMTDARLLPSVKDGKVEGFRVSEVKPAGIFAMVGLRNGDVLLRMNDLPVDSPEKAIQSLASLKGQNRIKLELVRDGQPATFSYDIR